jgi:hypothetical protein
VIGLTASRLNSRVAKAGMGLLIQNVAVCKQAVVELHLYKLYICCSRSMSISSGISITRKIIRLLRGDLCTLASQVSSDRERFCLEPLGKISRFLCGVHQWFSCTESQMPSQRLTPNSTILMEQSGLRLSLLSNVTKWLLK